MTQSLIVWNKAAEKDKTIADIVVGAKAPPSARNILKSMVDDNSSETTKEQAEKKIEELSVRIRNL